MLCTVYIELPLVKQKFHILSSKMDVPNMISLKEMLRKLFKCLNCKINFLYPNRTHRHLKNPYNAHKYRLCRDLPFYSNSIVAGGFPVQSYMTLFTPFTSFTILLVTLASTSQGICAASAVMKSTVFTARSAMAITATASITSTIMSTSPRPRRVREKKNKTEGLS